MKNLKILILSFALIMCSSAIAQNNTKSPTIIDPEKAGKNDALTPNEFLQSVLVIRKFSNASTRANTNQALEIELVNFNPTKKFLPAYRFDGIEYNDNGKYNDRIAGDGIFTSVTKHKVKGIPSNVNSIETTSSIFKYTNELSNYRSNNRDSGIVISCKVRTVTCPETDWWNTCWPLSSPCTCLEFYDCEVGISIL